MAKHSRSVAYFFPDEHERMEDTDIIKDSFRWPLTDSVLALFQYIPFLPRRTMKKQGQGKREIKKSPGFKTQDSVHEMN